MIRKEYAKLLLEAVVNILGGNPKDDHFKRLRVDDQLSPAVNDAFDNAEATMLDNFTENIW